MTNEYNHEAVQKAIDADKSIGRTEAKAIHDLLRGHAGPTRHTVSVTNFRGHRKASCTCGARFSPINQATARSMLAHSRDSNPRADAFHLLEDHLRAVGPVTVREMEAYLEDQLVVRDQLVGSFEDQLNMEASNPMALRWGVEALGRDQRKKYVIDFVIRFCDIDEGNAYGEVPAAYELKESIG